MKPYRPKTYSFEDAAHLMRRAGFGGTPEQIEELRLLGPQLAAEKLLRFTAQDGTQSNPHSIEKTFQAAQQQGVNNPAARAIPTLQAWWIHKMLQSREPLKEKLTLFWHGHFVSALDKVRNAFMLRDQNELFRSKGLGKFQDLVLEVSRDPAMLRYLDNDQNVKEHPNENYARELMELFTMGAYGGYTEKDVQEAARAFTGWTFSRGRINANPNPKFIFNAKQHDTGVKTVLGQTGKWGGEDVVRIVTNHPATPKFMTRKLWAFFVNEDAPDAVIEELSRTWVQSDGNIREVLLDMLTSEAFYAPENRAVLIKSPLEYVIGTLRSLDIQLEPGQNLGLISLLNAMAQTPFLPPDVSGWDAGLGWIADTTLLNRLNFVGMIAGTGRLPVPRNQMGQQNQGQQGPVPIKLEVPRGANTTETIDLIGRTLLGSTPSGGLRRALEAYAKGRNSPEIAKGLVYLVLASPQYHLA
jgi:uncharacterized protein (DUF1800 family)